MIRKLTKDKIKEDIKIEETTLTSKLTKIIEKDYNEDEQILLKLLFDLHVDQNMLTKLKNNNFPNPKVIIILIY